MVPRRGDDAAIEICGGREPIHVAVGMRAKLRGRHQAPADEPQRDIGEARAAIGRREQHDAPELARPADRKRPPHDDGAHAVTDEMEPRDRGVGVELRGLGGKPRRMRLDRSAHARIAPVHRAKALSRQGAAQRFEQHGGRCVPMHEQDGFACHPRRLALAPSVSNSH